MIHKIKSRRRLHGFYLTEIAVVLGVLGLIIGGVWIATSSAYKGYSNATLVKQILAIHENTRISLKNITVPAWTAANPGSAYNLTDQTCPNMNQCSTAFLQLTKAFPVDFIGQGSLVQGATYGAAGQLYTTAKGYPIWTGIYDCSLYSLTALPPQVPTCSGNTVFELDFLDLPQDVCTYVLMELINGRVDGLLDISTNNTGWGPVVGAGFGNPTLIKKINLSTATAACKRPSNAGTSYNGVWIIFLG